MIWYGYGAFLFAGVLAVLLHESAHAICANHFGVRAEKITLLPFGAQVSIDCAFLPRKSHLIILLAGSLANAAAGIFAGSLLWLFPQLFNGIGMFITANLSVALLNLLPIYPLDGGKIIEIFAGKMTAKILYYLSNIVFALFFIYSCVTINLSLGIFCLSMIISVNSNSKDAFVSKLCKMTKTKKTSVRELAVQSNMTLFEIYKAISPKYYSKFIITDKGNRVLFESELEKYLVTFGVDTKLMDILT